MFRHLAPAACALGMLATPVAAGTVSGKLELPNGAPEPPRSAHLGYLDRIENPYKQVQNYDPTPYLVVVLVGGTAPEAPPPAVTWDLLGESFAKPLIAVRVGTLINIKNRGKRTVALRAEQDPSLMPAAPVNIGGARELTPKKEGLLSLVDADIPHLRGRVLALPTPYFAVPDRDGKFEIKDVPPGDYKVRVWYIDGWIDRPDDAVTVPEKKGDVTVNPKIPAGYKAKAS